MTRLTTCTRQDLEAPRLRRRDLAVLLIAAACLQAIAWAALLALFSAGVMGYGLHELADTLLYQRYAVDFTFGHWPYSGVPVEYPPLANLLFLLGPARGDVATYEAWFGGAMVAATTLAAVLTTAAGALAWRSAPRGLAVAGSYAMLTLLCGALAMNRYDAVVALTVAAALVLLTLRRPLAAGVGLGLGFALKLTPALLLPLALILSRSRRRAVATLAAFALVAALPWIPFLLKDPGTAALPFTYHAERPLQLESVLATPWAAGALAGAAHPEVVHAYGSQNFAAAGTHVGALLSPWLLALAVGGVYLVVWRRRTALRADPALVPVAALSVLLAAICTSKVLSPQFLIWTFPVVALCIVQPRICARLSAVLVALAVLLTQVWFPARYWDLVALEPVPLALLTARNLILFAAAILSVVALVRIPPEGSAPRATSSS